MILHFNLATPGRNDDEEVKLYTKEDYKNKKQSTDIIYQILLEGIGGIDNLIDIDACATRLRVTVNNMQLVDDDKLKSTGAKGILKKGTGIQIVYGPQVAVIKSEFEEFIDSLTNEQI